MDTKIWNDKTEYKIGYLNINGFNHNIKHFDKDINLSNLSFVCIAETKLTSSIGNDKINSQLQNFDIIGREDTYTADNVAHMGMVVLQNKRVDIPTTDITFSLVSLTSAKCQYAKLDIHGKFSIVFVYINKTPTMLETEEIADKLKNEDVTFILGDFNINPTNEDGHKKINVISNQTEMQQINKESTRNTATLDLIFKKKGNELDFMPFVFENLYSDHSTIGFRYCKDGTISEKYNEHKIEIQDRLFLKKKTMDQMSKESQFSTDNTLKPKMETRKQDKESTKTKQHVNKSTKKSQQDKESTKIKSSTKQKKHPTNTLFREDEADNIVMDCQLDRVRLSHIRKLLKNEWVDSQVINCYMFLIRKKYTSVLTLDSWFNDEFKKKKYEMIDRRFKNDNVFNHHLWLIPINCNNTHWFLLTVDVTRLNEHKVDFNIYDSLGIHESWKKALEETKIRDFITWKYKKTFNMDEATLEFTTIDLYLRIPQQDNYIDCGVFTLMYAKYLAAGKRFSFGQDMRRFRKKISEEIKTENLEDIIWDDEEDLELPADFTEYENLYEDILLDDEEDFGMQANSTEYESLSTQKTKGISKGDPKLYRSEENLDQGNKSQKHSFGDEFTPNENQNKKRRKSEPDLNTSQVLSYEGLKIYRFENPGTNLCFSNAVTSVILNIREFQDILQEDIPTLSGNSVCKELKHLSQLPNDTNSSTKNLRRKIQDKCLEKQQNTKRFDNNMQHDAAEFLNSLLEHMLCDNPDIMNRLFGETQNRIFCMNEECNRVHRTPSNLVNIISLTIVGTTLNMCLDEYFNNQSIQRNCSHCNSQRASQVTEFTVEPTVLIFQMIRFKYCETNQSIEKMHNELSVETTIQLSSGASYEIVGAIFHHGATPNAGHYTAAVYCREKDTFYYCNDNTISEMDSLTRKQSTVYIVVYEKQ